MKINRPEINSLVHRLYKQEQAHGRSSKANRVENAGMLRKDSLEISAGSEMLKKELSRPAETDASRQTKVAKLARRVETGEYHVDSRKVAGAMLKYMEAGADENYEK